MARSMSLHLGLNSVDPNRYGGWDGRLVACENDARDLHQLAGESGIGERTVLLTQEATVDRVTAELRKAADTLGPGDYLFLSYSGHGGQVPDTNGPEDEPDRLDETMVLHDREFIDDELYKEFERFAEGVRIFVCMDSCHSGTGIRVREVLTPEAMADQFQTTDPGEIEQTSRLMPLEQQAEVYERDKGLYDGIQRELNAKDNRELGASALLISACQDNQLAADGLRNGKFTGTLLDVWNGGKFTGGYKAFHREILARMPATQSPNLYTTGPPNRRFVRQRPLTV
ncbi:caspase family protein [Streptomyces sp. B6B3]|uniref:caspase family protein n=1 Tax=Streptomyces sp. B6B3 TaxID=3153570 RepID=UPI00325D33A0